MIGSNRDAQNACRDLPGLQQGGTIEAGPRGMLDRMIDRVEARLAPHARALSVLAIIWFALGVAINARFLPLPDLPRALEQGLFWTGAVANALWWGWLRPAIEQRRLTRAQAGQHDRLAQD